MQPIGKYSLIMKKILRLFLFLISPLFFVVNLNSCKKNHGTPTVMPPARVEVIQIGNTSDTEGNKYSATVAASQSVTVSFAVPGKILSLNVQEGQKVSKGQLLGKLGAGDLENARNIAYAQLAEAQDGYNRLKKLHDANALPDVKWVEMQQKLKQAQNAAEMADRSLADASLYAPISGSVSRKFVETGEEVLPVQPIYEIVSTQDLDVEVSVPENEIAAFQIGDDAEVCFVASDIPSVKGKVTSKSVVADPLTRGYTVKIGLPGKIDNLLPGMLANVSFDKKIEKSAETPRIVLPYGSVLLSEDNTRFVWLVKDNKAVRRQVKVDELVADGILVTQGLNPGDTVIVAGMQKIGQGSMVEPLMR